jgi:predicted ATP-grasp superfamily ATP-dependent carboligase
LFILLFLAKLSGLPFLQEINDKITIPIMQTNKMQDSKIYFHRFELPPVTGSGGANVLQDIEKVESEKIKQTYN